jgi:hypothetical protein
MITTDRLAYLGRVAFVLLLVLAVFNATVKPAEAAAGVLAPAMGAGMGSLTVPASASTMTTVTLSGATAAGTGGAVAATGATVTLAPVVVGGALVLGGAALLYVGYRQFLSDDPIQWFWQDGHADPAVDLVADCTGTGCATLDVFPYNSGMTHGIISPISAAAIQSLYGLSSQASLNWTVHYRRGDGLVGSDKTSGPGNYSATYGGYPVLSGTSSSTSLVRYYTGYQVCTGAHCDQGGTLLQSATFAAAGLVGPTTPATIVTEGECTNTTTGVTRTVTVTSTSYPIGDAPAGIPGVECGPDEALTDLQVRRVAPGADDFVMFDGIHVPDYITDDVYDQVIEEECRDFMNFAHDKNYPKGWDPYDVTLDWLQGFNDCVQAHRGTFDDCVDMLKVQGWKTDLPFDPGGMDDFCGIFIYRRPVEPSPGWEGPIRPVPLPCDPWLCANWLFQQDREQQYGCSWVSPTGSWVPLPLEECAALDWQPSLTTSTGWTTKDLNTTDGKAPSAEPQPGQQPAPGYNPGTGTGTLPPPTPSGEPPGAPVPPQGCMSSGNEDAGWFSRWVFKGVACALQWAFVPSEATMTKMSSTASTASGKAPFSVVTGVVSWAAPFYNLPSQCWAIAPDLGAGGTHKVADSCGSHPVTSKLNDLRPVIAIAFYGALLLPMAWWAWRQYAPGSSGVA